MSAVAVVAAVRVRKPRRVGDRDVGAVDMFGTVRYVRYDTPQADVRLGRETPREVVGQWWRRGVVRAEVDGDPIIGLG